MPGKGNAEVEVERAAKFDELGVERLVVHRLADGGRDVEDDRNRGREFVARGRTARGLGAHGRERLLEFAVARRRGGCAWMRRRMSPKPKTAKAIVKS